MTCLSSLDYLLFELFLHCVEFLGDSPNDLLLILLSLFDLLRESLLNLVQFFDEVIFILLHHILSELAKLVEIDLQLESRILQCLLDSGVSVETL